MENDPLFRLGRNHPSAVITDESIIPKIRGHVAAGWPFVKVGALFGVSRCVVRSIAHGITYRHVPGVEPAPEYQRPPGHETRRATLVIPEARPTPTRAELAALAEKHTAREIAAMFGIAKGAALEWLRRAGVRAQVPERSKKRPTLDEWRALCRQHTTTQLAKVLGVAPSTIREWSDAFGVKPRRASSNGSGEPAKSDRDRRVWGRRETPGLTAAQLAARAWGPISSEGANHGERP